MCEKLIGMPAWTKNPAELTTMITSSFESVPAGEADLHLVPKFQVRDSSTSLMTGLEGLEIVFQCR